MLAGTPCSHVHVYMVYSNRLAIPHQAVEKKTSMARFEFSLHHVVTSQKVHPPGKAVLELLLPPPWLHPSLSAPHTLFSGDDAGQVSQSLSENTLRSQVSGLILGVPLYIEILKGVMVCEVNLAACSCSA